MKTYLAVDLGGTKIAAALVRDSIIVRREQVETPSSQSPSVFTAALKALLLPLSTETDIVAVASTGIIDGGTLTALNPDNLGGLNHYPLQKVVAEITGRETVVINDAQAAAWSEYLALGQPVKNMAFITVSTGVGAGLVVDEQLLIGPRGVAGHAGHMLADPSGPMCGCGRRGCVESMASGRAIGREGEVHFAAGCSGYTVYQHFLNGDEKAEAIIRQSARVIANLIADLTISLDLEVVALGGSVGLAECYIDLVQSYLSQLPATYQPTLVPATTGADAGLIGVARWAEANT